MITTTCHWVPTKKRYLCRLATLPLPMLFQNVEAVSLTTGFIHPQVRGTLKGWPFNVSLFVFNNLWTTNISLISFLFGCEAVSNQNTQQALSLPEKEVIQPHLPVRLPCYDFTPVTRSIFRFTNIEAARVITSAFKSSMKILLFQ
jgi:hypothetical protein